VELGEPDVPRLAAVGPVARALLEEVRPVDVVRVHLEGDQAQGVDALRPHDGHVVRRADGRAGDVRPRADAHERHPRAGARAEHREEALALEVVEEAEGVAPADEDGVGLADGFAGVLRTVEAEEGASGLEAALGDHPGVALVVGQRVGTKRTVFTGPRKSSAGAQASCRAFVETAAAEEDALVEKLRREDRVAIVRSRGWRGRTEGAGARREHGGGGRLLVPPAPIRRRGDLFWFFRRPSGAENLVSEPT
jgi:hypothetical protein